MAGEVIAFDLKHDGQSSQTHKPIEEIAADLTAQINGAELIGFKEFVHVPFTADDETKHRTTSALLLFLNRNEQPEVAVATRATSRIVSALRSHLPRLGGGLP